MEYPDEVPFEKVKKEVLELESYIGGHASVEKVILFLGSNPEDAQFSEVNSQNTALFHIVMKNSANTDQFIKKDGSYRDAKIDISTVSFVSFNDSTITLDVVGEDSEQLIQASNQVIENVEKIKGVEKVTSNQQELKSVYDIVIEQEKANAEEVARQIQLLLNPFPIGDIQVDGKNTNVLLDSSIHPKTEADLKEMTVVVNQEMVPLSSIAKLKKSTNPTSVLRKDSNEYIRISVQVDSKNLSEIANEITLKTKDLKLPKGVDLETAGAAHVQADQFIELFQLMAVSIGLVYLIMVLTLKTLRAR